MSTIHGRCQQYMKYHTFVFCMLQSYTSRIFVTNSDRQPLNFLSSPVGFVLCYFLRSLALLLVTAGQKHTKRINKLSLLECLEKDLCPNWNKGMQEPKSKVRRESNLTDTVSWRLTSGFACVLEAISRNRKEGTWPWRQTWNFPTNETLIWERRCYAN